MSYNFPSHVLLTFFYLNSLYVCVFNKSGNSIDDSGAEHLALMLKRNSTLLYLCLYGERGVFTMILFCYGSLAFLRKIYILQDVNDYIFLLF